MIERSLSSSVRSDDCGQSMRRTNPYVEESLAATVARARKVSGDVGDELSYATRI
jgi:hypothetical protein